MTSLIVTLNVNVTTKHCEKKVTDVNVPDQEKKTVLS